MCPEGVGWLINERVENVQLLFSRYLARQLGEQRAAAENTQRRLKTLNFLVLLGLDASGFETGSGSQTQRKRTDCWPASGFDFLSMGWLFIPRKSQAQRFPLTRSSADCLPYAVHTIRSGTILADAGLRRVRRRSTAIGCHQSSSMRACLEP